VLDDNQSIESRFAFPDFPKWVLKYKSYYLLN
jgi:hypothetical protein